ncbi:MAG: hypothetical protein GX992_01155 [Clostridium sp.]|nr:hypothetical protein [Clostridium sp.]
MDKTNIQKIGAGRNIALLIIGWISAVLSLLAYPFIFGMVGVVMGILATKNGNRAGMPLIVASIILMGIGLIFSGVIMNYTRHYLGM